MAGRSAAWSTYMRSWDKFGLQQGLLRFAWHGCSPAGCPHSAALASGLTILPGVFIRHHTAGAYWWVPVATMTMQLGVRPLARHLMFMNFSMPMSAPKPACRLVLCHGSRVNMQETSCMCC